MFNPSWHLPCFGAVMYLHQLYQSNMGQTAMNMFPLFVSAVSVEGALPARGFDPTAYLPRNPAKTRIHRSSCKCTVTLSCFRGVEGERT